MPLEVDLSDGLAALCLRAALPGQSIDAGMSSLNLAAVKRNLDLVWTEFLGWLLSILCNNLN